MNTIKGDNADCTPSSPTHPSTQPVTPPVTPLRLPLVQVSVLNVIVTNGRGQTLVEEEQVLPNGARRKRGLPLSEKLIRGERWQDAAVRGVLEELGPVLPPNPQVGGEGAPVAPMGVWR